MAYNETQTVTVDNTTRAFGASIFQAIFSQIFGNFPFLAKLAGRSGGQTLTGGTGTGEALALESNTSKNGNVTIDDLIIKQNGALSAIMPVQNLSLVVNASVNKLDVFAKTSGAVPASGHGISVYIPDVNGLVRRSRAAAYLSGTSQFIMADAANYWSKGSLNAEIKTAYVYAIWDGTGIVWALAGYSGWTALPSTTTTTTDDDYFLLEASSTYTRSAAHYCVCVGRIRYEYDTGDAPDHTIQATAANSPKIIYNPKSDYGYSKSLAADNSSGSDIADYSAISLVVKQPGKYAVDFHSTGYSGGSTVIVHRIRYGSGTYGSATPVTRVVNVSAGTAECSVSSRFILNLNYGDYIHGGINLLGSGTRVVQGLAGGAAPTALHFNRID